MWRWKNGMSKGGVSPAAGCTPETFGCLSIPWIYTWKIKWCKNYCFSFMKSWKHTCWPPCNWMVWPVWKGNWLKSRGFWANTKHKFLNSVDFLSSLRLNLVATLHLSRLSNLSLNWGSLDDNGLWGACSPHHLGSDHLEREEIEVWLTTGTFTTCNCWAFNCIGIWWISPVGVMICCTIWIPESKNWLRTIKHDKELNL